MIKPIFVTQPYLPPLQEFIPYLEKIWDNKHLTNNGPFHQKFESALCEYLGINHISLFTNGTLALVTALQSLRITGEVITTPYSFVATAHSLLWNNISPIFVDIDPETLNLDPKKIETAITTHTTAILPVHCYGHPCDMEAIQKIADNYNLKVIYDAAHAFGVKKEERSILGAGDLSILSFHATKMFNTFEGGAIICQNEKIKKHIDHLKNFGFIDEITVVASGINGKMSEFNAAFGLLQLEYIDIIKERRKIIDLRYREELTEITGLQCMKRINNISPNYSYFPILVNQSFSVNRDSFYEYLKKNNIYTRRYFYPLISEFPMYRSLYSANPKNLPVASKISREILCLPIYPELTLEEQDRIIYLIKKCAHEG